ncbi:MAG: hypothetical protein OXE42_11935 [Gammaproteobacteria bacterium]|nr:hypothetical protein [Gammaproteobacteria bacterium]
MTTEIERIEKEIHSLSTKEKAYQQGNVKVVPGHEAMQRACQRLK